ncbi:MAG: ABC transporter ATP-binding protein [Holophaga sp.]|jgi:branched-chain amino acid transport system ATP-binding protein
MANILEVTGLTKLFGGIVACNDLTFGVEEGKITGVIGPNGAGKTTIFNLVTGVYTPTRGAIQFRGEEIGGRMPDEVVKRGITRTFQNIRLFKNLSLLENVVIALDLRRTNYRLLTALMRLPKVWRKEKELRKVAMEYLDRVGLAGHAQARADSLPYGLQRKLEIARALALEPSLLLLDEPAAGMNPEESLGLADLIRQIREQFRLTVLLIEHHMDVVMELCDRIVVVNFGEKLAEGTPGEIQNDPAVLEAYLGEDYQRA